MEMGHQMAYGTPLQSPLVSVVGDCFCVPYLIDVTVKKTTRCLSDTHVDVRDLTGNVPDFQVIGCYSSQSFRVYRGKMVIAEVKDNFKLGSFLAKGHESFGVRVYPGVDYAFIVSLLVILNENDIF